MLELVLELFFDQSKSKNAVLWKWAFRVDEVLWEDKIDQKKVSKTEGLFEGIFDGFWLHCGSHFVAKGSKNQCHKMNDKHVILSAFGGKGD